MLIYYFSLIVVVLAAFLARRSRSPAISRAFLGIAFASMVLVAGMRDQNIGSDTGNYVRASNQIQTFADAMKIGEDYGFWILTWLVHFISDQYVVYLLAIAMIVVGCYQRVIVAHSDDIVLSFFVFITIGPYVFFFNGARQGIACAIYALSIGAMLKRNPVKYVVYVLVAFLFHKTAIMMLPVYLIFTRANTFKNNLVIASIGVAIAVFTEFATVIAPGLDMQYSMYLASGEGGGYYMVGISAVVSVFLLIFKKSVSIGRDRYDRYLNMILFSLMIGVISSVFSLNPSGLLRYVVYTGIAGVLIWPIVFKNLPDRRERIAAGYLFVVYCLVMFTLTTERFSDLAPYKFNPSLRIF
jgi:hypothetical protein